MNLAREYVAAAPVDSIAAQRIRRIESHFHDLIRERTRVIVPPPQMSLPVLTAPLPRRKNSVWFPVDGMYGGFHYWFVGRGPGLTLMVSSWCRVVGGSGERHEITQDGCRLVEAGFV